MKRLFLVMLVCTITACKAQKKNDLTVEYPNLNYIFSRMYNSKPMYKDLFNDRLFVSIYKFSDSKIPKGNAISETDEYLDSYLISVSPDGDGYSSSKLYKIEGVFNPKVIKIEEDKYPLFTVKIEHGVKDDRKVETYQFKGE